MASRYDDLAGALFLLDLLRLIPRHQKITAKQLKEQLDELGHQKSLRTIQRQLENLVLSGQFAIERDERNKPYGYVWAKNAKHLELAGISPEQALLLSLAYQELKFMLPENILRALRGFFEGAEHHLGHNDKPQVAAWRDKVASVPPTQPLLPPVIDDEIFANISRALFDNHYLDIIYQAQEQPPKPATVMPLALVRQEPRLYLVVRYQGYDDIRHLAVNRIKSAKISTFDFNRPDDFDLQAYIQKGILAWAMAVRFACLFVLVKIKAFISPKRLYLPTKLSVNTTRIITSQPPSMIPKCLIGGLPNSAMMCGKFKKCVLGESCDINCRIMSV